MKEFFPPNSYRYEEFDWHGEPAIRIQSKQYKDLNFVYNGEIYSLEDIRQAIELMEEDFKRHQ